MKRRTFVKLSGLHVGGIAAGTALTGFFAGCSKERMQATTEPVMVSEGGFVNRLSYPATAGVSQTLTAQLTTASLLNTNIPVMGYQANSLLGPTFRINRGDSVNIQLQNQLSEATNIHWHGLKVPALMDGHPDQLAPAGGSFQYQFTIQQRAGLSWYHPHPHQKTGYQVFQGLAGLFIINDAEEAALQLPAGNYELPLVIQDKRITDTGIAYEPTAEEIMSGYMGASVFVNGVHAPYIEVATRFYRLRILNGSNARIYNLACSNNADLVIIGNDGGLLANPVSEKEILIGPGERLDVLVNFADAETGSEIFLMSKAFEYGGMAQGMQAFNILQFKVTTVETDGFSVPATLSAISRIVPSPGIKTRMFDISNVMEHHGYPMNNGMPMKHNINGNRFDSNRIDERVAANTNEIWEFDNSKGDEPHPMHLHGVFSTCWSVRAEGEA